MLGLTADGHADAAVGAVANYKLMEQLGDTAMNCYRMRHFAAGSPQMPTSPPHLP